MDINFDPTWPAAQRLEVIEQLAYRMQSPPLLPLPHFLEIAEVIGCLAKTTPQCLEQNITSIYRALTR